MKSVGSGPPGSPGGQGRETTGLTAPDIAGTALADDWPPVPHFGANSECGGGGRTELPAPVARLPSFFRLSPRPEQREGPRPSLGVVGSCAWRRTAIEQTWLCVQGEATPCRREAASSQRISRAVCAGGRATGRDSVTRDGLGGRFRRSVILDRCRRSPPSGKSGHHAGRQARCAWVHPRASTRGTQARRAIPIAGARGYTPATARIESGSASSEPACEQSPDG